MLLDDCVGTEENFIDEVFKKKGKPKSYVDSFYLVRNSVIEEKPFMILQTYESIQSSLVSYNYWFNRESKGEKFTVGFLELLFFNLKMKRIHGNSYTEWNPELEYREKFLS
jgi:hypothetical protein